MNTRQKDNKDGSKVVGLVVLFLIIVLWPLPFALYMGGIEWLKNGFLAGKSEFLGFWILGVVGFPLWFYIDHLEDKFKKWWKTRKNKNNQL
ncbi:MAG: hypothetical protein J6M18_06490 [Actinomycetaceae bacterium]|nr:hypothetical protein [Actinomycetaceae bacterium]